MTSYRPPLDGIRVLELGSSVAGPAAARLLGDFGADVLKIESDEGDALHTWGPPAGDGTSWRFKSHNRNKRFLRFDLHDEADRATVREVALRCDVLLENFRPGRLDAWGLGYDALRAENPRLVYASISGYGQDGTDAGSPSARTGTRSSGASRARSGGRSLPMTHAFAGTVSARSAGPRSTHSSPPGAERLTQPTHGASSVTRAFRPDR